jgi:hypothetical protein
MKYAKKDCISAIQLVGWITGQSPLEITIQEYEGVGMSPSHGTVRNRLGSWKKAKKVASTSPQAIPSHLPKFYTSVAALRCARDLGGHPVTGLKYRSLSENIEVSYLEVLEPFRTWTHAKIVAGVHTEGTVAKK